MPIILGHCQMVPTRSWSGCSLLFSLGRTLPLPCTCLPPWSLTSGRQDRTSGVKSKCNPLGGLGDSRRPADTWLYQCRHVTPSRGG